MAWQRGGYCCRCGDCCVGNPFPDPDDPNASAAMKLPPEVNGYCPLFKWANLPEGPGFCKGHAGAVPAGREDPFYLNGCNVWPQSPSEISEYKNCTYSFTWVDD
jgi:hypothetical protein